MRFMMMVEADESSGPPSPELGAAIGQLTQEMVQAGVLLDLGGLLPSATGAKIRASGGKVSVKDGRYAIFQAKTKEEATELRLRFMTVHSQVLGASCEGELELRQLAEMPPS